MFPPTRQTKHKIPAPSLISSVTSLLYLATPFHCLRGNSPALRRLLLPHEDAVEGEEIDGGNLDELLGCQRLLGQMAAEVLLQLLLDGGCNLKICHENKEKSLVIGFLPQTREHLSTGTCTKGLTMVPGLKITQDTHSNSHGALCFCCGIPVQNS